MSNTRKVRRARSARDRAEAESKKAKERATYHRENAESYKRLLSFVQGEWEYHQKAITESLGLNTSLLPAATIKSRNPIFQMESGAQPSPTIPSSLSDPSSASYSVERMSEIRVEIEELPCTIRNQLTRMIHVKRLEGDSFRYAHTLNNRELPNQPLDAQLSEIRSLFRQAELQYIESIK